MHSGTEGGRTRVTYFAEEGVFCKTSARDLRDFVTPEVTGLPSLLPPLAAAEQAKSKVKIRVPVHPMSVF